MHGGTFCHHSVHRRPVKTLLIPRRVNAGKFSTFMTLLPYLFSVKWRKYHYINLINEFLANFLLYLPYRKCCMNADLTGQAAASEAATDHATLTNGPSGRLMSACGQHPAIRNTRCRGVCLLERRVYSIHNISQSPVNITSRCEHFV